MIMDLRNLSTKKLSNEGVIFPIKHPETGQELTDEGDQFKAGGKTVTGKGKKFFFKLIGQDSDAFRGELNRKMVKNRKDANVQKPESEEPYTDMQVRRAETCALCVIDCYLIVDGEVIDGSTSKEKLIEIFLDWGWMAIDAEKEIINNGNFMQG